MQFLKFGKVLKLWVRILPRPLFQFSPHMFFKMLAKFVFQIIGNTFPVEDLFTPAITNASTIFLTPIIYVGLVIAFISWLIYTPSKDFDPSQWLTNREERFHMSDDII